MPTQNRFRKYAVCVLYPGLILAILLLVSRNFVSQQIAERVGSWLLATAVRVDAVHIGWGTVQVRGITVFEPTTSDAVQVEIHRVDVSTSVFAGLSDRVWIDRVAVSQPTLHVRFDNEGQLLSVFPESESSSEGEMTIPLRSLFVKDAQLIVHQGDREAAMVAGANLSGTFGASIDLQARIDKLIEGEVAFQTHVDASSLAGTTVLKVKDCRLDCSTLPGSLLPAAIREKRFSGSVSAIIRIQHPPDIKDPRLHPTQVQLALRDMVWGDFGTVLNQMIVAANTDSDGVAVEIDADPFLGNAHLSLTANSLVGPSEVNVVSEVSGCKLKPLIARFLPNFNARATGNLSTRSKFNFSNGVAAFQNTIHVVASELAADNVQLDDVDCEVQCNGQVPLDLNHFNPMAGLEGELSGKVTSNGLDLRQLAGRLGDSDLSGRVKTAATFELPLDQWANPNALTLRAVATCEGVRGHGAILQDTYAGLTVSDGTALASMDEANLVSLDGTEIATVSGSAETSLSTKSLKIWAELIELDGPQIARLCRIDEGLLQGKTRGGIEASVSVDSLMQPDQWKASANLDATDLVVAGEKIDDVNARCELTRGRITVAPTILKWRENFCRFSLDGKLSNQLTIDAGFSAGPISLIDVADVVSRHSSTRLPLAGTAKLDGKLHADTKNLAITSTGTASLSDASFARTDIGSARLDWNGSPSGLTIRTGSDDMLGGDYTLTLVANQLDWTQATIESQFSGIQVSRLPRFAGVLIPVAGTLEGGCKFTSLGSLDELGGSAWIRGRSLSAMSVPIVLSNAEIRIASGKANVIANGGLLKGTFLAEAQSDLHELVAFASEEKPDARRMPIFAEANLSGISIQKAIQAAKLPPSLRPLSGLVDANCVRNASSVRDGLICTATASAERIRWNQSRLSDRMTATVELRPDRVELASVDGRFADGRLSGQADVSIVGEPRGTFQFGVDRLNLRLAAAPLGSIAGTASGTGSLRVTGRIGQTITGRADVSANNPSIANLNIRAVRFPVDWAFTPASNRVTWRCRSGVVEAGGGKINISTEGDYSRSLNMQLAARLNRIDTSRLLRGGSVGAGILDGQVNLHAKRARRPEQITGNFDLTMSQVDSLEMPVLDQLDTLVSLTPSLGSKHDNEGKIQGRLSGGLVHLDQLAISQSNVQVLMNGNASLDGRLNFDVTAVTGQAGPADGLMALTDSPLMLAAPAPVALVLKANEAMKDRVVHVHVGGTASRPTLRLQPGKNLTQDTLRFFLTNSFGSQVANAADTSQRQNHLR